jgi:hypothetical protein
VRRRLALLLTMLTLFALPAGADEARVRGKVVDPVTRAGVPGVQVSLTSYADTADVHRTSSADDGTFTITGLGTHSYRLEASRLGYAPLRMVVRVQKPSQDLGLLQLAPQAVNVGGVTVTESPAPAVVHGDTTEFRAGAVKINRDATAEDLVQKMPGVAMENGQVKVQGEQVQNVLVNGRPFFGSDPTAAMRNLPAEVVDRIQVYDKMSDQAEFSGFDDGQSQKTMNFIMRDLKAKFGKVYAGDGADGDRGRYQAGGNASVIRGATRVTGIAMSNNVNQQNFSPQDLIGALAGNGGQGGPRIMMFGGPRAGGGGPMMMRGGGGLGGNFDPSNFFVGQQGGITTTHSGGLNATGRLGSTLSLNGSVFVNQANNDNTQSLAREYVPPEDSTATYGQLAHMTNDNSNQRVDGRIEWTPDSSNSVIYAPRLYFQDNHARSLGTAGYTSTIGDPVASSASDTRDDTHGNNLTNRVTLRHRFAHRGRNVSADLSYGHTLRAGTRSQYSLDDFYQGSSTTADTLDQRASSNTTTNAYSARVAYTEPLGHGWQAQAIYNPSFTRSDALGRAFNFDSLTGGYTGVDSAQSNTFASRSTVQNGGLAALLTKGPWRWLTNVSFQSLRLRSEQTYPLAHTIDQTFEDALPSMQLTGNFANRRTLRLAWSTSTNTPSITQLQNVVDRSNPLALTAGNPGLRESYSNTLTLRYNEADPMHSKARFAFLNVSRTSRPIANATFTAAKDDTIDGIALARGTQLTIPENLDEASWSSNAFGVYSIPSKVLKSVVNFNGGGSFTQTPTRLGAGINVAKIWAIRSGLVLASNVSPNLDFTLSYQGSWNISRNSLSTSTSGDYYAHTVGLRFSAQGPHGIVIRDDVTNNLQSGVQGGYGRNNVLWNTTLGKKFFKNDRGELRVTLTDAFDQDRSVSRTITESYVQDTRDVTLGRFAQAVFTYTFR